MGIGINIAGTGIGLTQTIMNQKNKLGLGHFDAWAASFGETQTAIEFAQVL